MGLLIRCETVERSIYCPKFLFCNVYPAGVEIPLDNGGAPVRAVDVNVNEGIGRAKLIGAAWSVSSREAASFDDAYPETGGWRRFLGPKLHLSAERSGWGE